MPRQGERRVPFLIRRDILVELTDLLQSLT
jgi:hypothetical protein